MKHIIKEMQNVCSRNAIKCGLIIGTFGLFSGVAIAQTLWKEPVKKNTVMQKKAYFPVKKCINMGNGLNAPNEGDWSFRFEESNFEEIRAVGFDSVRIPIKWSGHISYNEPYTIDPKFLARVDQIITWALKNKLSIIIDVHDFDELFKDPKENIPKFMAIWTQLSYHYAKAPPEVIFEIINEPQLKLSGSLANKVQHDALAIIRQHNPTRTVILAGDHWGAMEGMDNLKLPPNDSNIVATVHYYNPFEFTVQGAEWLKEEAPPKGRHWPLKGEMQKLNDDISEIYNWREKLGVEVLIGEYGTDAAVPQNLRVSWAYYTTKGFKAAGLPTCYFNFASGFPIYEPKTRQWNNQILNALELNK